MKSKKKIFQKKHKTRANKKGANKKGGIGSFKLLSTDKTKIQANIAKLEEINTLHKTPQFQQILGLLEEIKDILDQNNSEKKSSPLWDYYEMRDPKSIDKFIRDNTDVEPDANLDELVTNSQQRRTFVSLVKEALDSNNIKNKDDLDKFCEGVGRKRLYAIIRANCLKSFSIEKCNSVFNYSIRGTYQTLLPGYKQYKPRKGTNA